MRLVRSFLTVGGLTGISRIAGFVRDVLVAATLGTGAIADAFVTAFQFPNLFRRLFGEGAFNAAFVPLFTKKLEGEGRASAHRFAEDALAGLLFVLLIVTALAMALMPWLMYIIAPGFLSDPEKFDLTVVMTRIAFPYLLCMSLVALLSGVLNALGRFTAAAAAPIVLNVVLIGALALAQFAGLANRPEAGILLVWGVAVAGFLQLSLLAVAAYRAGMGLGFRRPRLTPDMRALIKLGVPGVIAGGVMQINLQVGGIIASFADGARAALYYADRLYQLPVGIVGVAIGVVLLPEISRRLRQGDTAGVEDSQNRSLEFALLFTLPATAGLIVCAEPIVRVLFERGAFTALDTTATAGAVVAYAIGLPAFVIQKVLQPAYFAREDTATPMRFAWVTMGVNVVAAIGLFLLFRAWGYAPHVGIALATSLAAIVNAVLLWGTLSRRGHFNLDARTRWRLPVLVLGSLGLGLALYVLMQSVLGPLFVPRAGAGLKALGLGALLTVGGIGTLIMAASIGFGPRALLARVRNRRKG